MLGWDEIFFSRRSKLRSHAKVAFLARSRKISTSGNFWVLVLVLERGKKERKTLPRPRQSTCFFPASTVNGNGVNGQMGQWVNGSMGGQEWKMTEYSSS